MAAANHSATAAALLAEIGLTDSAELWELTHAPDGATGPQRAAARLALDAAQAITKIDDTDRLAGQKLARLGQLHAAETTHRGNNLTGNAAWLAQAAAEYGEQLARAQAAIEAYRAAAYPLALILGLTTTYGAA